MATGTDAEAGCQLVDTAGGTAQAAFSQLVGHGVGESFDGLVGGDDVPVEVEEGVQLIEAEPSVATEQGEAGRTKRATAEAVRVDAERWQGWLVVVRRATAVAPVDARPETVADLGELAGDALALFDQRLELVVEHCQGGEQLLASGVQAQASSAIEARGVAHRELAVRTVGGRSKCHGGPFLVGAMKDRRRSSFRTVSRGGVTAASRPPPRPRPSLTTPHTFGR